MNGQVLGCPRCGAPLAPSRFARSVVCAYCRATVQVDPAIVSAAGYRAAYERWSSPASHGYASSCRLGDGHWSLGALVARGEIADVYRAERARWPSERVLMKVLRDPGDGPLLDHEWEILAALQSRAGTDAPGLSRRLPQPVVAGVIADGVYAGRRAAALRFTPRFRHTLEAARGFHPSGIAPRATIWVWRRVLELLAFVHRHGLVHGAVLPQHLLLQDRDHGIHLVGYSCADPPGAPLRALCTRYEHLYPEALRRGGPLAPEHDLQMAARCVIFVAGGDPVAGEAPRSLPAPLAALLREAARDGGRADAWTLREEVGAVGRAAFGAPAFCPIEIPAS